MSARILLVEDDAPITEMMAMVLTGEGYAVTAVTDATAALAAVEEAPPDLLILDLMLPGGRDGIALLTIVAQRQPHIPVLIITAYPLARAVARAAQAAPHARIAYLAKPFRVDTMLANVALALRGG